MSDADWFTVAGACGALLGAGILWGWLVIAAHGWWQRRRARAGADWEDIIRELWPDSPTDQRPIVHRRDCACEEFCWPAFVARMRHIAARQAAELNQQGRRP